MASILQHVIGDEPMIKTILVPTGGSDTDFVVSETALAVAQLFRAHLEFFHVRVDAGEAVRSAAGACVLAIPCRSGDEP